MYKKADKNYINFIDSLSKAIYDDNEEVIQEAIAKGFAVDDRSTILISDAISNNSSNLALLLFNTIKEPLNNPNILYKACLANKPRLLNVFLKSGKISVNKSILSEALAYSVDNPDTLCAGLLLDYGADPRFFNNKAIIKAVKLSNSNGNRFIKLLLDRSFDIANLVSSFATQTNNNELLELLGSDVDWDGVLVGSTLKKDLEGMRKALDNGAATVQKALRVASTQGFIEGVKLLLQYTDDVSEALDEVMKMEFIPVYNEVISLLLEGGGISIYETTLYLKDAIERNNLKVAEVFMNNGGDIFNLLTELDSPERNYVTPRYIKYVEELASKADLEKYKDFKHKSLLQQNQKIPNIDYVKKRTIRTNTNQDLEILQRLKGHLNA